MNFDIIELDGIKVFSLNEKKLDTNNSGLVKAEVTSLIKNENITKLIIDLSDVETCDSSGLSALLVANRLIASINGEVVFVTKSSKLVQLISITQLHRVLKVTKDIKEAISELNEKK